MPATRSSSRISAAREAASAAPLGGADSSTTTIPNPPAPAPPAPELAAFTAMFNTPSVRPPANRYRVTNPVPFPKGDLYLDLGSFGSGDMTGYETCSEGGEGYPVARFKAKIYLRGSGSTSGTEIGYINARLMGTEVEDFHEMCDELSAELQTMSALLFDDMGSMNHPHDEWIGDILYIEEVFLKQRYRGYGVGLLAVDQLINQIPSFNSLIVIMAPCPLNLSMRDSDDASDPYMIDNRSERAHTTGKTALRNYYARIGFQRLTTPAQEKRSVFGLQLWGLWTGYNQPDIKAVVPNLF